MRYWLIQGFESSTLIFEEKVKVGQFTDLQIQNLLKTLEAKAGLSNSEIIGAYAKRRTKIANPLLDVTKDRLQPSYSCGDNPFFTASLIEENGTLVKYPSA